MRLSALPALEDNYIWVLEDTAGTLVVDPGEAAPVIAHFDAHGGAPDVVLLTHHHPDHCGGVATLQQRYPSLVVHAPDDPRIALDCHRVRDGDVLELLRQPANVIGVPGHTRSHVAYLVAGHLFCGDALFSLGCGRMFEGTPEQMHASLQRLAALDDDTLVCCGHEYTLANAAFALAVEPGNDALHRRHADAIAQRRAAHPTLPARLADERACNPFLRCHVPAVRDAVAARNDAAGPLDDVSTFAALRAWKDGFTA